METVNMGSRNAVVVFAVVVVVVRSVVAVAEAEECAEELISFSACLPYVSNPPNNLTESASEKCCDAVESKSLVCLCYLLHDPLILGFPLNTTRILSLSSICSISTSFPFLCSSESSSPLSGGPSAATLPFFLAGAYPPSSSTASKLFFTHFLPIFLTLLSSAYT